MLLLLAKFQVKLEKGKVDHEALDMLDKIIRATKRKMKDSEHMRKGTEASRFAIYHAYRNIWLILRKMRGRFVNEIEELKGM